MRSLFTIVVLLASTQSALAACYADYKAKQDDPLRLQYGVVEVPGADCTAEAASAHLTAALSQEGWQLLEVIGTFDESGLDERRDDAGEYYLRY